ncbi:MAG: protein phosphatase 2C domain-containing protein [Caldilineaceae bacterium]
MTQLTRSPSIGGHSDEGYVHKKNEDAWHVFRISGSSTPIYVAIVADGVTSTAGGAQASQMAVRTLEKQLKGQALPVNDPDALQRTISQVIQATNHQILEAARQTPEHGNMSTTLVMALVVGDQLMVAHLGDSRAYLIRGDSINRLTLDHTWGQEALDKQRISQYELENHPNRNVIRRYLGITPNIQVDWNIARPGTFQLDAEQRQWENQVRLEPNDVVLLCSDGLTDKVTEFEMLDAVQRHAHDPQKASEALIKAALNKKEQDNITAVLLSYADKPLAAPVAAGGGRSNYVGWLLGALIVLIAGWLGFSFIYSGGDQPNATPTEVPAVAQNTEAAAPTPTTVAPTETIAATPPVTPTEANAAVEVAAVTQRGELTATVAVSVTNPTVTVTVTAIQPITVTKMPTPLGAPTVVTGTTSVSSTTSITAAAAVTPQTPTATLPAQVTRRPTSTPVPTATITPIPTATSTGIAATAAPTRLAGAAPVAGAAVELVAPNDGDSTNSRIFFKWEANFELDVNQAFELVFWRPGQDPMRDGLGLAGSGPNTSVAVSSSIAAENGLGDVEIEWGVLLVNIRPYERIKYLGGEREFRFEGSGGGSGGGSGCGGALVEFKCGIKRLTHKLWEKLQVMKHTHKLSYFIFG